MIIDMRLRPPYGGYLDLAIFKQGAEKNISRRGYRAAESFLQRSVPLLIEEMDATGTDMGVILGRQAVAPWGFVKNEEIVEIVSQYPDRLIPFGGVEIVPDSGAMVAQVEQCMTEFNFVGINLEPGFAADPTFPDDPLLYPVYEKCEELGALVSVSTSAIIGPDVAYSDPIRLQHACKDFPNIKWICSHGAWPYVQEIVGVCFVTPNLYLSPDFYMNVEYMPFALEYVNAANQFLEDRLLYGSSYPVRSLEESVDRLAELPFRDDDVRAKVAYKNAFELFEPYLTKNGYPIEKFGVKA
jgi:predicted TIM-barrel fold metal-dependent hydrolase